MRHQTPSPRPARQQSPAPRCTILPPYLLERIAQADPALRERLEQSAADAERLRARRELRGTRWSGGRPPAGLLDLDMQRTLEELTAPGGTKPELVEPEPVDEPATAPEPAEPEPAGPQPDRTIYDAQHGTSLPGVQVRAEGEAAKPDESVNEAYDGLGHTYDLFLSAYGRDSLDGAGMALLASVHYGQDYDNAFWDGQQMVFGDGDGVYINSFTDSVDVIGHELTHGLTQFTAGLTYVGQPGALNESVSDVFGSLVRQWVRGETAEQADWLIGAELFTDKVNGVALRSMKAPGTAYDDPVFGTDPQPATMSGYVELPHDAANDNGGVHINSGIPNHAFYLAATALGGSSWERAGQVWYDVLITPGAIARDVDFAGFATATVAAATTRFGADSPEVTAIRQAWEQVGVLTAPTPA